MYDLTGGVVAAAVGVRFVEIVALGCRDLKAYDMLPIYLPHVEFDLGDRKRTSEVHRCCLPVCDRLLRVLNCRAVTCAPAGVPHEIQQAPERPRPELCRGESRIPVSERLVLE